MLDAGQFLPEVNGQQIIK